MKKITLLIILIFLFSATGCTKTYDLKDYCYIDTSGYSGAGTVHSGCNIDLLATTIETKKYSYIELSFLLDSYIDINKEYPGNLKNGDTVTYSFEASDELQKALGVKISPYNGELKVNNLTELIKIDPFENIDVVFEGISPSIKAKIINKETGEELWRTMYYLDKSYGIKNGETVTVSIDKTYDYNNGYEYTRQSAEYKCEGMMSYVDDFASVDIEDYEQLTDIVKGYLEEASKKTNISKYSPGAISYIGSYTMTFLNPKDIGYEYNGKYNKLYVYYQQPYSKDTVYYEIILSNLLYDGDNFNTNNFEHEVNLYNAKTITSSNYSSFDKLLESKVFSKSNKYDINEIYIDAYE